MISGHARRDIADVALKWKVGQNPNVREMLNLDSDLTYYVFFMFSHSLSSNLAAAQFLTISHFW